MTARVVPSAALASLAGQEIGVSDWLLVTQEAVNAYADATNDHQWICEDVERAKRESAIWWSCRARLFHPGAYTRLAYPPL